ncbi:unnamed protein product, partial [Laminaria digitata]
EAEPQAYPSGGTSDIVPALSADRPGDVPVPDSGLEKESYGSVREEGSATALPSPLVSSVEHSSTLEVAVAVQNEALVGAGKGRESYLPGESLLGDYAVTGLPIAETEELSVDGGSAALGTNAATVVAGKLEMVGDVVSAPSQAGAASEAGVAAGAAVASGAAGAVGAASVVSAAGTAAEQAVGQEQATGAARVVDVPEERVPSKQQEA